jgi:DNA-binding LytR/AlgR family response regulator
MNCLIVEDEPLAAAVLQDFIREVSWLNCVGRCSDAMHAMQALHQPEGHGIDLLFLDIHLPGLKGLDFLRTLSHPPQTILTTAYHEYALEGYELGVVDYLLKPIDFERFLKAVQKVRLPEALRPQGRRFHFFNCNKKMVRVWLDEIAVVESLKEYVRLHLTDGRSWVTKGQLAGVETLLAGQPFLRVHRSFVVALAHITAFTATEIEVGGQSVPVGRQYKAAVQEALAEWCEG